MASPDLSQLSSNWKKLQANLQPTPTRNAASLTSLSSKRKRPADSRHVPKPSRKKRQMELEADSAETFKAPPRPWKNGAPRKELRRVKSASAPIANSGSRKGLVGDRETATQLNEAETVSSVLDGSSPEAALKSAAVAENEGVSQTAIAGKYIALDCEMVGYGPDPQHDSQLARVSIVNFHGQQLYDSYVLPLVPVTDYRTPITGITAVTLKTGRPFKEVQSDVAAFLKGRVLVGHALSKDFKVLMLSHPRRDIRDTSRHANYRALSGGKTPGLKRLCLELLGLEIQRGAHSSVEDARAAMLLYKREKDMFEAEFAGKFGRRQMLQAASGAVAGRIDTDKTGARRNGKK